MLDFFDKIRRNNIWQFIWPINANELPKFLPMAFLMFFILLNQNIVRALKDSLVVTTIGSEVLSFIKLWGEMPFGILFVLLYTVLCNHFTTERVFQMIVIFFIGFFSIFAFILFPYKDFFHPLPTTIDHYMDLYPHLRWFILIWGKWSFVLFYIMGELWPIIVFSLLFWQLANKITHSEEAKRFYPFFNLFGQTNLLISGSIIVYFSNKNHFFVNFFLEFTDPTEIMLKSLMVIIIASGFACLLLHRIIETRIVNKNINKENSSAKPQVLKLGLKDSTKIILKSKYLGLICILAISYSTTIGLIEGLWMFKTKQLFSTTHEFIYYQGKILTYTGFFTLFVSFLGSTIIRKYGWWFAAVLTPLTLLVIGSVFFISVLFQDYLQDIFLGLHYSLTPLVFIVGIGGLQNVLGKGVKYSLFDSTKEMSYIPLDDELKTKGKAGIDIMGAKVGKSLGAIIQFITFTILPSARHDNIAGFLMALFVVFCIIWIIGVNALAKMYNNLLKKSQV